MPGEHTIIEMPPINATASGEPHCSFTFAFEWVPQLRASMHLKVNPV